MHQYHQLDMGVLRQKEYCDKKTNNELKDAKLCMVQTLEVMF